MTQNALKKKLKKYHQKPKTSIYMSSQAKNFN